LQPSAAILFYKFAADGCKMSLPTKFRATLPRGVTVSQ
jgi:hypothetical protein